MDLKILLEERKRLNAEFAETGKKLLKEYISKIFEENQELQGIRWTAYTPLF